MVLLAAAGGQLGAIVIAIALLALSLVLFAIGLWSFRWPKVTGVITVSIYDREWKTETEGTTVKIKQQDEFYLAYTFKVQGSEYASSSIKPNGDFEWQTTTPGLSSAADRARWYREGKQVDVYYCPFWPKWSCLEPGGLLMPIVVLFASVVVFIISRF